jgi:MarR family transcriptional regulator, negative regulator of the multidrug operon emrRAB
MHSSSRSANLLGALGIVIADALAEAGGDSEAAALVALGGPSAGASIDALSAVVGLSHSGTVRLVDRLEADGLVERRRGADQRSAALLLTPSGRRAARQTLRRRDAEMEFVLSLLTDDQQRAVIEAAERVLGELGARPDAEQRICRLCDVDACGRSRGECPVMPARRRRQAA